MATMTWATLVLILGASLVALPSIAALPGAVVGAAEPPARAAEPPPRAAESPPPKRSCLSQSDTREIVAAKKLFPPFSALREAAARGRGETIGIRLCRSNEDLMYDVTVLRRDGRVVKVIIDAVTGKIARTLNDH